MDLEKIIDTNVIAWEECARFKNWERFYKTLATVIFKPLEFFSKVNNYKRSYLPLFFGMSVSGCSLVFHLIISLTLGSTTMINELSKRGITANKADLLLSAVFLIALFPLFYTGITYLFSGFLHLLVRFFQGRDDFNANFRIINYSWAVSIFSLIPFLGAFLSSIGYFTFITIGTKIVHNLSWTKTIASIVTVYLGFLVAGFLFLLVFLK